MLPSYSLLFQLQWNRIKNRFRFIDYFLNDRVVYLDLITKVIFRKGDPYSKTLRRVRWRARKYLDNLNTTVLQDNRRIAVFIHAFYPDILELILSKLETIDTEYSIFISTTGLCTIKDAEDLLNKYSLYNKCSEVIAAPNRGRNFGSFLVNFSKIFIREFDIILHVHTKKSPHSSHLANWNHHLFNNLLSSTQSIGTIINLLSDQSKIGLIFPARYEGLGYLHDPWDGLKDLGNKWLIKQGFTPAEKDFLFPEGGMFWARVDAIRPILDFSWSWNDFASEENPNSVAFKTPYVLERLIGIIPNKLGYEQCFIEDGHLTTDRSFVDSPGIFSNFFKRLFIRDLQI